MDWFTGFLRTIKEQSPYYNMIFAIVCLSILFLPVFFPKVSEDIPEIIAWRKKYLPYIGICFVVFFVFGGGQFVKKIVDNAKVRKAESRIRRERIALLSRLENLYNQDEVSEGRFKRQDDCIEWANKTAPLLRFNTQYYSNFLANTHRINIRGLSGNLYKSCVSQMVSQLRMAIEELKSDLNENT